MATNPKKRPPQKQQLKDSEYALTPRQLKKLIGAAPNLRDRTLIKLLAVTGLRRFEIRNLDLRDIDFRNRILQGPARDTCKFLSLQCATVLCRTRLTMSPTTPRPALVSIF